MDVRKFKENFLKIKNKTMGRKKKEIKEEEYLDESLSAVKAIQGVDSEAPIIPLEPTSVIIKPFPTLKEPHRLKAIQTNKLYMNELEKYLYEMLLNGYQQPVMIDFLLTNGYCTSYKRGIKMIENLYTKISDLEPMDPEEKRSKLIMHYQNLYFQLYQQGLYSEASKILDSIAKLQGLIVNKNDVIYTNSYNIEF